MAHTKHLERREWGPYFDNVSKRLAGKTVAIEVASLALGSQVAAEWLPLYGIMYDHKNDLVAVMAEGIDHMIRHPRDIFVETEGEDLLSMQVIQFDNTSQIIRLREPLPPAAA
ncbi:DUF5335 family protein [Pseudoduganella buxea]|uniref:Uncharacterized protein n=1 Tax=Pseudoduganella buxea TaxID=1949069 RepID=A0A6I3T3X1_9BURK|nr:DUF5335 family protein [Pseudoduganella buxea]MTV55645.1 hypothetical protein [Pseudoduganella buxea]GGC00572.1 hypothetical protein GCM10011572_23240 [Pseudoduganella buxea]